MEWGIESGRDKRVCCRAGDGEIECYMAKREGEVTNVVLLTKREDLDMDNEQILKQNADRGYE